MGFLGSSSSSNNTCPSIPTGSQYGYEKVVGSYTFSELTTLLCGIFTAIVYVLSAIQLFLHATHFSNPAEQAKIMRIIALIPTFALVYLIAGADTSSYIYLQPWADTYEAVALASYFLLLVTYMVPDPEKRDSFFDHMEHKSGGSSLKWYRWTWIWVFQYIVVAFLVAVATDITQAVGIYCPSGSGVHFAKTWLTVIKSISVGLAFIRLLQFYSRCKDVLKPHAVVAKLAAVKGIIGVTFLQTIVFTILNSLHDLNPDAKLTYNDIFYGIPSIITCGEMVLFSLFYFYAYGAGPYNLNSRAGYYESHPGLNRKYYGGRFGERAFLVALNPLEIASGIATALKYAVSSPPPSQNYDRMSMGSTQHHEQQAFNPQATSPPPVYQSPEGRMESSASMEYGTTEQYTPLPGRGY